MADTIDKNEAGERRGCWRCKITREAHTDRRRFEEKFEDGRERAMWIL